jgi:8-oxo-dGTP pyrophosphatase MutT (NUDIX family)
VSKIKPTDEPRQAEVRAAGGIVLRPLPGRSRIRQWLRPRYEIVLVHRPRYDDWSLPKGKPDGDDERDEDTALREVEEETGLRCRLGAPVGETRYEDSRGRDKVVRYWLMELPDVGSAAPFVPNREVDELRWLEPGEAARLLTYPHDRELLERLFRRGPPRP